MTFWINITLPFINFHSISLEELKKFQMVALNIQGRFNLAFREKKIKVKRVRNFTLEFGNYIDFSNYDPFSPLNDSAWISGRYFDITSLDESKFIQIILKETNEVLRLLALKKELPETHFDECVNIVKASIRY